MARVKTGGRSLGTPNKVNPLVKARLVELGCDPLEKLVGLAKAAEDSDNINLAAKIYTDLLAYIAPKNKPIDLSETEKPEGIRVTIVDA